MNNLERVARAICAGDDCEPDAVWQYKTQNGLEDITAWKFYERHAQAAIDAMQEWMPIETAPKDWTEILIYSRYGDQYVVSYDDSFRAPWRIRNEEGLNENILLR